MVACAGLPTAEADAAITSLTVRCGPTPTALTAEACGPWSRERVYVRWFVTTTGPALLGPPSVDFPAPSTLPAERRCRIDVANPATGFGDGVHTQLCQASHPAGNVWVPATPAEVTVRVDEIPPTTTPTPSRPPDANGWYNAPVTIAWVGADTRSGVARCTPAVTYSGPDTPGVAVTGSCTDNVGRVSDLAAVQIRYDATPPTVTNVTARATSGEVAIRWQASADTASISVRRTNRVTGKSSVIFTGLASEFVDRKVVSNGRYTYTVTAVDQAGVRAQKSAKVSVSSPLRPAAGTQLRSRAVVLSWPKVSKARYYNVQLFVGRRKVLSTWPSTTKLRVAPSWRFNGRTYRLPLGGKVRWYVWPAMGAIENPRFGPLIGTSTFRIRR